RVYAPRQPMRTSWLEWRRESNPRNQIAHDAEHTLTHAVPKLSSALIHACPATNSTSTNVQHCSYSGLREKLHYSHLAATESRKTLSVWWPTGREGRNLDAMNSQRCLTAVSKRDGQGWRNARGRVDGRNVRHHAGQRPDLQLCGVELAARAGPAGVRHPRLEQRQHENAGCDARVLSP